MRTLRMACRNRREGLRLAAGLLGVALGAATGLSAVRAQTAGRVYRLGVLRPSAPSAQPAALIESLRSLGDVEGRTSSSRRDTPTLNSIACRRSPENWWSSGSTC